MASQYDPHVAPRPHLEDSTQHYPYPPNSTPYDSNDPYARTAKSAEEARDLARTPSPTPSEAKELKTGVFDWKTLGQWRFWIRREWLWYYVALVVILVLTTLMTIYHKQIVDWLTPVTRWLHDLKFGWLVPIGVLFVISFPPLFGHEIVAVLCGLVWGLWIGFAIVSAGTFLGEVGNFYAFKYCCRARGEKLERTKISYACLAKVVRDGGFKIALIARLSAIPGHFTTAVFSTCGMGIIVFSIAAILSMPKQFITVYLGVILEQSNSGVQDTKSRIISDVVIAVTIIITVVAMWYIFRQMNKVKPEIIYARRKARQAKLARAGLSPEHDSFTTESTVTFDPRDPDNIPLTAPNHSKLDGYAWNQNPNLYAPQPVKPGRVPISEHHIAFTPPYDYGYNDKYGGRGSESTDDVTWEMGSDAMKHPRSEDTYGPPYSSTESVNYPGRYSRESTSSSSTSPPSAHHHQQQQQYRSPDGRLAPPPLLGRLPNPHAEVGGDRDEYVVYAHTQEPTDVSYRTAMSGSSREPSFDDDRSFSHAHDHSPLPPGAQTPSPPGYRVIAQ
ncbi:hypothetical protein BDZ94DRAFT_1248593 [Collybia nuda]|uniref:Golgi apparatus membrane protein TVP38 n=1 Tax=Collybia nuda TaxID=64659 RepID=A0A9P6CIH4_9AGAR|nr:hypothetical protein BDZ94DRAFT_1248593 [Collybia nuda]